MKKRTRIVPSLVITATFVGVIPACALGACGGTTIADDGGADGSKDGSKDAKFFADGVAADAFNNDVFLGVAAVAMCCFDASGEGG